MKSYECSIMNTVKPLLFTRQLFSPLYTNLMPQELLSLDKKLYIVISFHPSQHEQQCES